MICRRSEKRMLPEEIPGDLMGLLFAFSLPRKWAPGRTRAVNVCPCLAHKIRGGSMLDVEFRGSVTWDTAMLHS